MKFKFLIILIILSVYSVGAMTFSLKDNIEVKSGSDICLSDVVFENVPADRDLCIKSGIDCPTRITISDIIECFSCNGVYDITVFGSDCLVRVSNVSTLENVASSDKYSVHDKFANSKKDMSFVSDQHLTRNSAPVKMLERYLSGYVDDDIDIRVKLERVVPPINLENVTDYKWELAKIKSSLADIVNIKRLNIFVDGKKHFAYIDVSAFANVYIAGVPVYQGECFKRQSWQKKRVDISLYRDCQSIVTDIDKASASKFSQNVEVGEVLRWSSLTKIPFIYKGEHLTAVSNKGNIKLSIPAVATSDGYRNEKIKVRLLNGNEIIGILNSDKTIFF